MAEKPYKTKPYSEWSQTDHEDFADDLAAQMTEATGVLHVRHISPPSCPVCGKPLRKVRSDYEDWHNVLLVQCSDWYCDFEVPIYDGQETEASDE